MTISRDSFSRSSNAAGAPLPLIPRRTPSASRSHSSPAITSTNTFQPITPVKVYVERPSPDRASWASTSAIADDSDTTSSSSSSISDGTRPTISVRAKRVRGVRIAAICPPEESTPTPALLRVKNADSCKSHDSPVAITSEPLIVRTASEQSTPRATASQPLIYTPGISLRLTTNTTKPRTRSHSHIYGLTDSQGGDTIQIPSTIQPKLVRKKSGQPVKSSLKATKPTIRGSLTVVTMGMSSKSEPSTPTHKAVHFDSHLEHVKLFLAEQKPLAVSRDGSPTDDTSGTDSDFPSFIYGDLTDDKRTKKNLVMDVVNLPRLVDATADIAMEELILSHDGTSILGRVRVRNIAFAKWIAVRFTFDSWQTTSEVTAKYLEPIGSEFDRFNFSIRLNDLLARIDGKVLFLALRYTVDGREIWDNNGGKNYHANFSRAKPGKHSAEKAKPIAEEKDSAGHNMSDLHGKLEKVVQGGDEMVPSFLARRVVTSPENEQAPLKQRSTSLAARYDFGASLREPWKPTASPCSPGHLRQHSHPATSNHSSVPWPEKNNSKPPALGSPRDLADVEFLPTAFEPVGVPIPIPHERGARTARNHQRGYFDLRDFETSGLKRTPPGTPVQANLELTPMSNEAKFFSFPPIGSGSGLGFSLMPRALLGPDLLDASGSSEMSTPSFMSSGSSSSGSSSSSPTESFMFTQLAGQRETELSISPTSNYRQFLNKFCFYTGTEGVGDISPATISRTQSVSDVEEFFAGASPRIQGLSEHIMLSHSRSSSLDAVPSTRSGSSTPTAPRYTFHGTRSPTPLATEH